ncbi:MAG: hypothetical protein RI885_308 [Actinomycetota bacterium]
MAEGTGEEWSGRPPALDGYPADSQPAQPAEPRPLDPRNPATRRSGSRSPLTRRSFALRWGIAFAALGVSFVATVIILNSTLYSAAGFTDSYLGALARHDIRAVLDTPGVQVPDGAARDLLTADALGALTVVGVTAQQQDQDGRHRLTYEIELDGTRAETVLTVAREGTSFWLFPSWRFAVSPVATLEVTPRSASGFEANGMAATAAEGVGAASAFPALVPSAYAIGQDAELFMADRRQSLVTEPGSVVPVTIEARATERFVDLVQRQLDDLLDECVTQAVLQPTGCPFGKTIRDRIVTTPAWSMTTYPPISIVPGTTPGTWVVPRAAGAARLVVDVRSLFDGTVTTLDEDVAFDVGYLITVGATGQVNIVPQ